MSEPEQENITPFGHAARIASLIYKVMEKELLSDGEQADLNAWIKERESHARAYAELQDRQALVEELKLLAGYDTQLATKRLFEQLGIEKKKPVPIRSIGRWTAVAAMAALLATGAWFWATRERGGNTAPVFSNRNDVLPGGNKAVLTLADGSKITLDSAHAGQLTRQGGATIVKQNGQITYRTGAVGNSTEIVYNTITTPRGGQYRLVLPDGSKVMLNAASSLRYPTIFSGRDRQVELTGEAYFDIAKNASQPFFVKTRDMDVKVLGTQFNVMAYTDEPEMRTTLIDGSVQVRVGAGTRTLVPGQTALIGSGRGMVVQDADTDKEIAWTTGFFQFDHTDIHILLREITRWYDIEVVYQATMNDTDTYSGRISRNLPLSDLTAFLEGNGIHHFRIEGRKLTVLP